jgi:hypothetical protein
VDLPPAHRTTAACAVRCDLVVAPAGYRLGMGLAAGALNVGDRQGLPLCACRRRTATAGSRLAFGVVLPETSVGGAGKTGLAGGTFEAGYRIGCGIPADNFDISGAANINPNMSSALRGDMNYPGFNSSFRVTLKPGVVTVVPVAKKTFKGTASRTLRHQVGQRLRSQTRTGAPRACCAPPDLSTMPLKPVADVVNVVIIWCVHLRRQLSSDVVRRRFTSAGRPRVTSGSPRLAVSAAMRMSQARAISSPPPNA